MELTKSTIKKICGIIVFAGLVFFLIKNFESALGIAGLIWGILFPFIVGAVIAFIINIPMRFIEKKLFKKWSGKGFVRPVSMVITLLLVVLVIAAVVMIVVPQIGSTTVELVKSANDFLPKFKSWADELLGNHAVIKARIDNIQFDMDKIVNTVTQFIKNGAGSAVTSTLSAAKAVVSGITSFAIGFVFACYLLMQKETLSRQVTMLMDAILPKKAADRITYIAKKCDDTFSSFISGQCLEAVILGTMFFITLTIMRMPYALLIGVLIAFTALIPIVGAFIGCIIGAFLILMVSPVKALIFIITFLVLQQIEGNFIYPKVVGGKVGLPSMWVLVAVTVGSSLMGVVGMLFFIPLTSVIYSLIKEWTYDRLEKKNAALAAGGELQTGEDIE